MVPLDDLHQGMLVKIVDEWNNFTGQALDGAMDKYLGQVVTILGVFNTYATIEEDAGDCSFQEDGHWCWNRHCFDYIVTDKYQDEFEPASDNEIFSLLFGVKEVSEMKYTVRCVRYGVAEVEAENEEDAIDIAETLPSSAYSWSDTDDHEVVSEAIS